MLLYLMYVKWLYGRGGVEPRPYHTTISHTSGKKEFILHRKKFGYTAFLSELCNKEQLRAMRRQSSAIRAAKEAQILACPQIAHKMVAG
jgi:hypothetical protein